MTEAKNGAIEFRSHILGLNGHIPGHKGVGPKINRVFEVFFYTLIYSEYCFIINIYISSMKLLCIVVCTHALKFIFLNMKILLFSL